MAAKLIKIIGDLGLSIIDPKVRTLEDIATRSYKRRMAQGYIRRLLTLGKGQQEIIQRLEKLGRAYQKRYMNMDIRRLALERLRIGSFKVIDMLKRMPSDFIRMRHGTGFAKYYTNVRYRVQYANGQWSDDKWITVTSNRIPTGQEALRGAEKLITSGGKEGAGYEELDIKGVAFSGIEVYRNEHVRRKR